MTHCCWCGEDLEEEKGRMIWISDIDGSYGHKRCIEKYDYSKRKRVYLVMTLNDVIGNVVASCFSTEEKANEEAERLRLKTGKDHWVKVFVLED